jgi:AmmeMemoRadiSam system protein B
MLPIRPAAFAGQFYPADEAELKAQIEEFLKEAKPKKLKGKVKALIVPHAGYQYSGPVAAYGYKLLELSTVNRQLSAVLLGPSHRMMFPGIALSNFDFWQTPLGNVHAYSLYKKLLDDVDFKLVNEAHAFEHSIEVQLPFLQTVVKDLKITPLLTGRVDEHKQIAKRLSENIDDKTLIIVSSDLSHYLPYKEAVEIDKETIDQILNLDTYIESEQACGTSGIIILIELAKLLGWKAKLLDYRNSGDTSGDKDKVVGYASIAFYK